MEGTPIENDGIPRQSCGPNSPDHRGQTQIAWSYSAGEIRSDAAVRAQKLASEGKTGEAIEVCRSELETKPDTAKVSLDLADVLAGLRDFEGAAEGWSRGIELPDAPSQMGRILALVGRLETVRRTDDALRLLDLVTQRWPDEYMPWISQASLHFKANRPADRDLAYDRAISVLLARTGEVHPSSEDLSYLERLMEFRGRLQESEQACRRLVELEPENAYYLDRLADLTEQQGRREDALEFRWRSVNGPDGNRDRWARLLEALRGVSQLEASLPRLNEIADRRALDDRIKLKILLLECCEKNGLTEQARELRGPIDHLRTLTSIRAVFYGGLLLATVVGAVVFPHLCLAITPASWGRGRLIPVVVAAIALGWHGMHYFCEGETGLKLLVALYWLTQCGNNLAP